MNITTGFDPESNRILVTLETNLLKKYYPNLVGMLSPIGNKNESLKDLSVSMRGKSSAQISLPVPKSSQKHISEKNKGKDRNVAIAVDREMMSVLFSTINRFVNSAMRKELLITEFVPLEGYDIGDLKKDIYKAIEGKRNFCIIDTYENYLSQADSKLYTYNQYIVEFGTDEYADVAILIESGEMNELKKIYSSKLKETVWL